MFNAVLQPLVSSAVESNVKYLLSLPAVVGECSSSRMELMGSAT